MAEAMESDDDYEDLLEEAESLLAASTHPAPALSLPPLPASPTLPALPVPLPVPVHTPAPTAPPTAPPQGDSGAVKEAVARLRKSTTLPIAV